MSLTKVPVSMIDGLSNSNGAGLVGSNDGASGTLWTTVAGFISRLMSSAGASVIGFIQAGTGATARTMQDKARDVVSVKDFGAVGDGAANDSTAFVRALARGGRSRCAAGKPTSGTERQLR